MSSENLEFKWGTKKGVGGKNKEAQFYASFTFDGVDYELHDCVYMWKDDESEPFVGKIIKIWEDKAKKVKILWFFKPSEISKHLGDVKANENELFLASGEGLGLANVNHLEAIAGKCYVVCISKDDRNPQPTKEEFEKADYVFYRIFDVGQLIVSDTIPETIPGVDIKFIFNQRKGQQDNVPAKSSSELLPKNEIHIKQNKNGDRLDSKKTAEGKSKATEKSSTGRNSHLPDRDDGDELNNRPFKKPKFDSCVNPLREKDKNDPKLNGQSDGIPSQKLVGDKKSNVPLCVSNDLVRKGPNVDTHADGQIKGESKVAKESNRMDTALPARRKLDEEVQRDANEKKLKASDQTLKEQNDPSNYVAVVTQKTNADRRRWFKDLPWEERMENARRQGTLVLLENLDPSCTSSDVEDIIQKRFNESCAAKIFYCAKNRSPLSGQAFVVFKTKEVAEKVVSKLEHGCLMLSNGRPLIASFANPCIPGKETLFGHFGIDKLAVSRDKKEAVSTAHCSQSKSIEYDFAMDWCLLQERYKLAWTNLKKQHTAELKQAMDELKTKMT